MLSLVYRPVLSTGSLAGLYLSSIPLLPSSRQNQRDAVIFPAGQREKQQSRWRASNTGQFLGGITEVIGFMAGGISRLLRGFAHTHTQTVFPRTDAHIHTSTHLLFLLQFSVLCHAARQRPLICHFLLSSMGKRCSQMSWQAGQANKHTYTQTCIDTNSRELPLTAKNNDLQDRMCISAGVPACKKKRKNHELQPSNAKNMIHEISIVPPSSVRRRYPCHLIKRQS